MKANLMLILAILLTTTNITYSSIEKPATREEFEQKLQQQHYKITELEALVAEQEKQILDLKWEIRRLEQKSEPNEVETERFKIFIEKQTARISQLEELCRRTGIDPNSKPNNIKKLITEKEKAKYEKKLKNYKASLRRNKRITRKEPNNNKKVNLAPETGKYQKQLENNKASFKRKKRINHKEQTMQYTQWKINKAIFGVYLGETIDSIKTRYKISREQNIDELLSLYSVPCEHQSVKELLVSTYRNVVISIVIFFNDSSAYNMNAIKDLCEKKYDVKLEKELAIDPTYSCITERGKLGRSVQVRLTLEKDYPSDKLILMYGDLALINKYTIELEAQKASKIRDQL